MAKYGNTTKAVERAAAAATSRSVEHWMARALPMTAAPIGFTVLAPVIEIAHLSWGGNPTTTPFITLGTFAMGSGLTWYTYIAAGRRKHLRILATATAGSVTSAVIAGLVVGLPPIGTVYALGAVGLSVAWAIRHVMKWAGADGGQGEQSGHPLGRLGEHIDTERFTLSKLKGNGKGIVQGEVVAEIGATIEEFQDMGPVIAAAARVPAGSVQIRQDPDDAALGHFRMAVADLLKNPIPFPGPVGMGASITKPIPVGRYEHGDTALIEVTAVDNGVIEHLLIMGVSGAGKSAFARAIVTLILLRRRVAVIAIDVAKGLQSFGCVAHGLTWLITDTGHARRFIKAMEHVIRARADHLTGEGLDYWTEESSLTFLVIWVEEAADLFSSKDAYAEMLRKARSTGIWIVSSLQRASHENLSTDARTNHGASACFGVRDQEDASMALPGEVLDAGAAPFWKTSKPGYLYLTGVGTDPENWTAKLRGYDTRNKSALAAAVTAAAAIRDDLDQVTIDAFGQLWDYRTTYDAPIGVQVPDPATAPTLVPGVVVPAPASTHTGPPTRFGTTTPANGFAIDDEDDDYDQEDEDDEDMALTNEEAAELLEAEQEAAELLDEARREYLEDEGLADEHQGVGIDTTIDDGDDIEMEFDSGPEITAEQAREMFEQQLHAWVTAGKFEFGPKDLTECGLIERMGATRYWFFRNRDRYVDAGIIASVDGQMGRYDILRSPLLTTA